MALGKPQKATAPELPKAEAWLLPLLCLGDRCGTSFPGPHSRRVSSSSATIILSEQPCGLQILTKDHRPGGSDYTH